MDRERERSHSDKPRDDQVEDKWPLYALIIDCETTIDERQALNFGWYRFCRLEGQGYVCVEEGIFGANELTAEEAAVLHAFASAHEPETVPGTSDHIRMYTRMNSWIACSGPLRLRRRMAQAR
jgi:hypothetical protein